jgi:deoxyadenosine/deoxycytidine kinase
MTVIIEGIIGAGKTYACDRIKQLDSSLKIKVEEVNSDWISSPLYDVNILDARYKPSVEDLAQMYILMSFGNDTNFDLQERSIYSAYHIFSKKTNAVTLRDKIMQECYFKYYRKMIDRSDDIIVFLDVDPKICLRNIRRRKRPEERRLTLDYLEKQRNLYLDFLKSMKNVRYVTNVEDCITVAQYALNEQKSRHIWHQAHSSD